jgi:hypothetical protein
VFSVCNGKEQAISARRAHDGELMTVMRSLASRALQILREEGLSAFLRHSIAFPVYLLSHLVEWGSVYLYEYDLGSGEMPRSRAPSESYRLHIVHTNEEADQLAARGFEDLRTRFIMARRNLSRGAIAFCIHEGRKLANVGWIGLAKRAKECIDRVPYGVDFEHGETFTGGDFTVPDSRGKGLMFYNLGERVRYLQEGGRRVNRDAVPTGNVASQRVTEKFAGRPWARAFYVRLFGWSYFREQSLERDCLGPPQCRP